MRFLSVWIAWVIWVQLLSVFGLWLTSGGGTDPACVVRLEPRELLVDEFRQSVELRVIATSPPASDLLVRFRVVPGNPPAEADKDYRVKETSVRLPAHEKSALVTIDLVDDKIQEQEEVFLVAMVDGPGYQRDLGADSSTVRIADDDTESPLPIATFSEPELAVKEGDGLREVVVRLSGDHPERTEIRYEVERVERDGRRQTLRGGSVYVEEGKPSTTIPLQIPDDKIHQPDGTELAVVLHETTSAKIGQQRRLRVRVLDDDPPPQVELTVAKLALSESSKEPFTITATLNGATDRDVVIDYELMEQGTAASITATPGSDFRLPTGPLRISPEQTSATLKIDVLDDKESESEKEVLSLKFRATPGKIKGPAQVDLEIIDDDGVDGDVLVVALATTAFLDDRKAFEREFERLVKEHPRLIGKGIYLVAKEGEPVLWTPDKTVDLEPAKAFTYDDPLAATFNRAAPLTARLTASSRRKNVRVIWIWTSLVSANDFGVGEERLKLPEGVKPYLVWVGLGDSTDSPLLRNWFGDDHLHRTAKPAGLADTLSKEFGEMQK
ncbi:MAG: hypothetical protein IT428_05810 [Planctomycetaceae bacterium]|nr:hypothetical protein [Planctomycetaceae bacterium]